MKKASELLEESAVPFDAACMVVREMEAEALVTDRLLEERQKVLDAIPECPVHGRGCVPHAMEWIALAKQVLSDD